MEAIFTKYLEFLWQMFMYDMEVLSQPWMYYWLLVPAIAYIIFFFCKWIVLTTPVWIAPFMALQALKRDKNTRKDKH